VRVRVLLFLRTWLVTALDTVFDHVVLDRRVVPTGHDSPLQVQVSIPTSVGWELSVFSVYNDPIALTGRVLAPRQPIPLVARG